MPQSLMSYQFGQSLTTDVFSSPHLFAANLHINPAWFRSILVFIATLTTLRHIFTTLKFSHLPRSLKIIMVSARVPDEGYVSSSMSRERIVQRILDDIEGQRRGKDRAIIVVLGAKDIDDLNKRLKELEPKPEKGKFLGVPSLLMALTNNISRQVACHSHRKHAPPKGNFGSYRAKSDQKLDYHGR